jgi:hypothetical protein
MAAVASSTANSNMVEDEEDYMNMVIAEPIGPKQKETYTQRRLRKEREAEARGRVKSKAEREAEAAAARDAALSTSLLTDSSSSSKGLKMMAKMGFKPGAALGAGNMEARTEPINISMKEDRGGIGMDSEKKRKFREAYEEEAKRIKAEEGGYRDRVRTEREQGRLEGMVGKAMRVAERMAEEKEDQDVPKGEFTEKEEPHEGDERAKRKREISTKPLKSINVLWRGLVRQREEKERDRRMRYDLHQSLSRLPTYDDPDEDKEDRRALGKDRIQHSLVEDLEEEDPELDEFDALDPGVRLEKLVKYLSEEYNYCFWCKYKYPNKEMEGCPGLTEEDHD